MAGFVMELHLTGLNAESEQYMFWMLNEVKVFGAG